MSDSEVDEEALTAFLMKLANTAAGQGMHFANLLASACAAFNSMYDSYPDSFRRIKNEWGELIGIEVMGD